jgi:hypothetical protein
LYVFNNKNGVFMTIGPQFLKCLSLGEEPTKVPQEDESKVTTLVIRKMPNHSSDKTYPDFIGKRITVSPAFSALVKANSPLRLLMSTPPFTVGTATVKPKDFDKSKALTFAELNRLIHLEYLNSH